MFFKREINRIEDDDDLIESACSVGSYITPSRRILPKLPQSERKPPKTKDRMAELHHQSLIRLKSAFESIFERYGKDFEGQSDEVDIRTGEILVDKGMLRRTKPKAFGDVYKMKSAPLIDSAKARELLYSDQDVNYDEDEEAEEVDESYEPRSELDEGDVDELLLGATFDFLKASSPSPLPVRRRADSSPLQSRYYRKGAGSSDYGRCQRISFPVKTTPSRLSWNQNSRFRHPVSDDEDELVSSPADYVSMGSYSTSRKRPHPSTVSSSCSVLKRQRYDQNHRQGLDGASSYDYAPSLLKTPSGRRCSDLSSPDHHQTLLSPSRKFLETQAKLRPSKPSPLSKISVIPEARDEEDSHQTFQITSPLAQKTSRQSLVDSSSSQENMFDIYSDPDPTHKAHDSSSSQAISVPEEEDLVAEEYLAALPDHSSFQDVKDILPPCTESSSETVRFTKDLDDNTKPESTEQDQENMDPQKDMNLSITNVEKKLIETCPLPVLGDVTLDSVTVSSNSMPWWASYEVALDVDLNFLNEHENYCM